MKILSVALWFCFLPLISAQQLYSEEEIKRADRYLQANQLMILNKYDEALEMYEELLEDDPQNAVIHHDMARMYLAKEEFEKAKKSGKSATTLEPRNLWYHLTLASICETMGEPLEAANSLEKAFELDQDLAISERWINALVISDKRREAIDVLDRLENMYGLQAQRSKEKAALYLDLNDIKNAEKELQKVVKRYPNKAANHITIGDFYVLVGNEKKAQKAFENALGLEPDNEAALMKIKSLSTGQGDSEIGELEEFISDNRIGIDSKIKTIIPIIEAVDVGDDMTLQRLNTLTEVLVLNYPQEAKAHAIRGDVMALSGNYSESIQSYKETLRLDKSVFDVWKQLMRLYLQNRNFNELENLSKEAMDYYPNQSQPYIYLSYAHLGLNEISDAQEWLEEAVFIAGSNSAKMEDLAVLRSRIAIAKGNTQEAITVLEEFVNEQNSPHILELIGDLFFQNGNKMSAVEYWRRALDAGANEDRINKKIQES